MLELDPNRQPVAPKDASTLVVVRDGAGGGVEVFCVERQKGGFLGGAVVFPGGKVDPGDLDASWAERATAPRAPATPLASDAATLRGLAVAACREALEEAALLPIDGAAPAHAELVAWRARLAAGETSLQALLAGRGLRLDLGALHPFARWITPVSESRRFDTRFYLFVGGAEMTGAHDGQEVTASFWAAPAEVLRRFDAGKLQLAPPTHRTLEVLSAVGSTVEAVALAAASRLEPICPKLFTHHDARGDALALALPGDPEHDVREPRCPGKSRFVLREGRFLPEDPPA
jgi:8-oxo-dGTP pyrophosphatase MutT (NUDIX family)